MLLCCLIGGQSYAALNGTYTINASIPASATNYQSFQSAIEDMLSGTRTDAATPNGIGVTGPVTFHIAPGTYTGQIEIPDTIPGASALNHITFEGTDASTRIIQAFLLFS